MGQTPMLAMQSQINIAAISDTVVTQIARYHIGLVGASGPMATGRKCLGGYSAPIGGTDGDAGYYPVIYSIQIVPGVSRKLGVDFSVTSQVCPGHDSSPGRCTLFLDHLHTSTVI